MLQWIYELLMSKQDKQVVVQIMQLWLAKPKAFKVEEVVQAYVGTYNAIKSSDFSIEYNLSNGECKLGDLSLQTGWFAKKLLQMFATQQALLCFHENAAKKLLAEEAPTTEKSLTANEKRAQDNAHDAIVTVGAEGEKHGGLLPQSVIIKKLYKEKENTPVVLKPPFTEDQIKAISGKKVVAKLRDGSVRTSYIYHRDSLDYPIGFLGEGYTLKGWYFTGGVLYRDERDIMEIKLEENV